MPWPQEFLATITAADEIDVILSSPGRPAIEVPIWVVTVGDEIVVRSYTGVGARWYRRATLHPHQQLRVGQLTVPVTFERMPPSAAVDDAYDEKYARFDYVAAMSKPQAVAASLKVLYRA